MQARSPDTKRSLVVFLAFLIMSGACAGCSSIWIHGNGGKDGIYPGARGDAELLLEPDKIGPLPIWVGYPLALIDLPLSAVVDTLLLPVDLAHLPPGIQSLADNVKAAGTEEQWRVWAAQIMERSKTNSSPIRRAEMPEFVQRGTPEDALGSVRRGLDPDGTPVVVVTVNPFVEETTGVVIGPPSYIEFGDKSCGLISKQVYPGIYVRRSPTRVL